MSLEALCPEVIRLLVDQFPGQCRSSGAPCRFQLIPAEEGAGLQYINAKVDLGLCKIPAQEGGNLR